MAAALPRSAAAIAKAFTGTAPRAAHRAGAPRLALPPTLRAQSLRAQRRHLPRPAQALPALLTGDLPYDPEQVDIYTMMYNYVVVPACIMSTISYVIANVTIIPRLQEWLAARRQPPASSQPAPAAAEQPAPAAAQHPSADGQLSEMSSPAFQEFVLSWMAKTDATLHELESTLASLERRKAGMHKGDATDEAAEG